MLNMPTFRPSMSKKKLQIIKNNEICESLDKKIYKVA